MSVPGMTLVLSVQVHHRYLPLSVGNYELVFPILLKSVKKVIWMSRFSYRDDE